MPESPKTATHTKTVVIKVEQERMKN